jgi:flagellar biosynthesis/type III secretory pathway chaperone
VSASNSLHLAERLKALLEEEFEALKSQDLAKFESLNSEKSEVLAHISALASIPATGASVPPEWRPFLGVMAECKGMHQRNHLLIQRKLDAIRAAIKTLQGAQGLQSVDIYDKLGRMSGGLQTRGLGDA